LVGNDFVPFLYDRVVLRTIIVLLFFVDGLFGIGASNNG
jgi:hypothetical protein